LRFKNCSMPRDWTVQQKGLGRSCYTIPLLLYVHVTRRNPNHRLFLLLCGTLCIYTYSRDGIIENLTHSLYIPPRHYSRSFGFQFKYLIVWHFLFSFFLILQTPLIINAFLLRPSCLSPFFFLYRCTDPRLFLSLCVCVFVCV
jgi:hypothetical protein